MYTSDKYQPLQLIELIKAQLTPVQHDWLCQTLVELNKAADLENALLNFSVVIRRKFEQPITLTDPKLNILKLNLAELVRIILIYTAINRLDTDEQKAILIKQYYQLGDESEKCALLKGLNLFDSTGYAVQTAIRAGRCNSLVEYAALALNNPYPSLHFAELNFNQLVLKSLFMGLDISQLIGLSNRANSKLSNMCFSYAIEQALADRIPPVSIWQAIIFSHLNDENQKQIKQYLTHFSQLNEAHKTEIEQQLRQQKIIIN